LLQVGASLAAAVAAGCQTLGPEITRSTDRTFDPRDADDLAVATTNGRVVLSAGDVDRVTGTITERTRADEAALDAVEVVSRIEDGTLVVETDRSALDPGVSVSVDMDLTVPASLAVARVRTENGDISVTDVAGDGTFRSDNGDVSVTGVGGYVTARTSNGDVTVREPDGLDGASTTNGDLDVAVPSLRQDATCESTNGNVTAAVPPALDAAVTLTTDNGDLRAEAEGLAIERVTEKRLTGRLGGDAHRLTLRSVNGDVTLTGR
jgi:hypothetical protein